MNAEVLYWVTKAFIQSPQHELTTYRYNISASSYVIVGEVKFRCLRPKFGLRPNLRPNLTLRQRLRLRMFEFWS